MAAFATRDRVKKGGERFRSSSLDSAGRELPKPDFKEKENGSGSNALSSVAETSRFLVLGKREQFNSGRDTHVRATVMSARFLIISGGAGLLLCSLETLLVLAMEAQQFAGSITALRSKQPSTHPNPRALRSGSTRA